MSHTIANDLGITASPPAVASSVIAVGRYVPEKRLTNRDLEEILDTSDEWIRARTGMRERRISAPSEYTSDVAIRAVADLREKYPTALDGVGMIITASMTPDYLCPNVSSLVQAHFELPAAGAMDLNCACAGFAYALIVANGLLASRACKKVLIIGAETMSKIVDYDDRTTCILFGDGAGAMVLEAGHARDVLGSHCVTDGRQGDALYCTNISKRVGPSNRVLTQDGRRVFKWAVSSVVPGVKQLLASANLSIREVDWFIPHSANARIIDHIADKLEFPRDRMLSSLEFCANTASASIPLAFSEGVDAGKIKQGDTVLLYGFGGGLTQAGAILKLNVLPAPALRSPAASRFAELAPS